MSELTQRVRAKYPGVYDDLSDADLEKAVLTKHPEYADLANKTPTRSDVQVVGRVQSDDPREQIQEPTTFWGGFSKSLLDQMGVGNPDSPLSHAARPQSALDVGSLLLPNAVDLAAGAGAAMKPTLQRFARPEVARAIGDEIPIVNRVLRIKDKVQAINDAAHANTGGRLVTEKAPSVEQQIADALAELRQPSTPATVTLPPAAEVPPGFTPRTAVPRISGAKIVVPSPSAAVALEADAPAAVAPLRGPVVPTPADLPRSWHAFLDDVAREQARTGGLGDPATVRQAQALHKELAAMDARYKGATVNERAQFRAMPASYKDALISALIGK